jgi:hypothetical protein
MTTETAMDNQPKPRREKPPHYALLTAWATPILLVSGWALLAAVPLSALLVGSWTDRRIRPLRWWVSLTAALYAVPLGTYLASDSGNSLSQMLDPVMATLIALSAAVVIVKLHRTARRRA